MITFHSDFRSLPIQPMLPIKNKKSRLHSLAFLFIIVIATMTDLNLADVLSLSVVNTTNVLTFLLFLSRVKWPNKEMKLGISTILMAIPAIVIASLNTTAGREWVYWVMPLIFVAWAILALVVDVIRKEEFRQPRNPKILVPFLLLFYISLGGMGALTWQMSLGLWALTAATFALQFCGMVYAFRHGKG